MRLPVALAFISTGSTDAAIHMRSFQRPIFRRLHADNIRGCVGACQQAVAVGHCSEVRPNLQAVEATGLQWLMGVRQALKASAKGWQITSSRAACKPTSSSRSPFK